MSKIPITSYIYLSGAKFEDLKICDTTELKYVIIQEDLSRDIYDGIGCYYVNDLTKLPFEITISEQIENGIWKKITVSKKELTLWSPFIGHLNMHDNKLYLSGDLDVRYLPSFETITLRDFRHIILGKCTLPEKKAFLVNHLAIDPISSTTKDEIIRLYEQLYAHKTSRGFFRDLTDHYKRHIYTFYGIKLNI